MKTNILKTVTVILGASVALSGCIKETHPDGSYVTPDQIQESPFAQDGLLASISTILITNYVGIGEHFDFGYPSIFGATDRLAGEVFPVSGNLPGGNQYYDRWQGYLYPYYSTGLAATGYCTPFFYLNYYNFIKTANDVIDTVGESEAAKESRGVAKTFRASFYLDLARLYDPLFAKAPERPAYEEEVVAENIKEHTVPIVFGSTSLDEMKNNPRATREEIFTLIFSDLDDAEECLANYTPATKSLPSLAVVYGLKARAYLWLGGFDNQYANIPTGEAAYRKAAEYARKAITASGCTIMNEAQWTDPITGFNTVNGSWMWAMIQSTDTVLNNLLSWTAHMSPEAIWGYGYGAQPGISVFSYQRINSADFRRKVFVGPDRSYAAIKPYTNLTEDEFKTIAPYASFKFHTHNGEKNSYTIGNVTDIPIMRVEEMYLTEAEAQAHYDIAAAKASLNAFMANRAPGYSCPAAADTPEAVAEECLFQKRIEFWGEGIVFYDMKRLNIGMQNGNAGTNAPSMAKYTTDGRAPWWNCVIPSSAVDQNKALIGNNNPDPTKTVKSKE